jgi:Skp family chaperone for outer membrane proteins
MKKLRRQDGKDVTESSKTFTQEELDAIINRRFAKFKGIEEELQAIKADREKLAQEEKERTEKELAEQNKWKELADQRELEIAKLNDELTPFKLRLSKRSGNRTNPRSRRRLTSRKRISPTIKRICWRGWMSRNR